MLICQVSKKQGKPTPDTEGGFIDFLLMYYFSAWVFTVSRSFSRNAEICCVT
jgi:hypothetical protein